MAEPFLLIVAPAGRTKLVISFETPTRLRAAAMLTGSATVDLTAWQYAMGADTVEYVRNTGATPGLTALVRQAGQVVGRVETVFRPDGTLVSSRLYLPQGPSRLELTFTENTTPATFKPDIWTQPQQH